LAKFWSTMDAPIVLKSTIMPTKKFQASNVRLGIWRMLPEVRFEHGESGANVYQMQVRRPARVRRVRCLTLDLYWIRTVNGER